MGIPPLAARMQKCTFLLSIHAYDIKYWKSEFHEIVDSVFKPPLPMTHAEQKQANIFFYFKQVEEAPATWAQVCQHTRNDPVLSKRMHVVVSGRNAEDIS